jgi:serine/threonine protein phosphatase 1
MPSIAIGDIHGNLPALNDLLAQLEPTLSARDEVIFLGDYVDRGPDSRGCIDRILRFRAESAAPVVLLRGNHEDWLMSTMRDHRRHSWLLVMDAYATIESYSSDAAQALLIAAREAGPDALYGGTVRLPYEAFFEAIPAAHTEFFDSLKLLHETDDAVFVHAGLDTKITDLRDQSPFALLMGTFDFVDGYRGPPVVVYGHHNNADVRNGWPNPRVLPWASASIRFHMVC